MNLNGTTRRVAVRLRIVVGVACLCLMLGFTQPATAQRMGGRGGMGMRNGGFGPPMSQPPFHSGLQLGLSGRWWDDRRASKSLNLRSEQKQRMDTIFEANKPALINLYTNLQREEIHLASLPPGDLQDETKVFAAIDRVSQARTDLEKEKAHWLLQIRSQLDPQQLQELDRQIASVR